MGIANYTTKVAVTQTVGDIQAILNRRGISRITTLFDDDARPVGLAFVAATDYGSREFEVPVRTEGVFAALIADTTVPKNLRTREQAERVAWRIAHDWLRTQGALVDADMATLDEIMLPFMLAPDGSGRLYAAYRETHLRQIEATA